MDVLGSTFSFISPWSPRKEADCPCRHPRATPFVSTGECQLRLRAKRGPSATDGWRPRNPRTTHRRVVDRRGRKREFALGPRSSHFKRSGFAGGDERSNPLGAGSGPGDERSNPLGAGSGPGDERYNSLGAGTLVGAYSAVRLPSTSAAPSAPRSSLAKPPASLSRAPWVRRLRGQRSRTAHVGTASSSPSHRRGRRTNPIDSEAPLG